jgi:glycerol-3-phosphate acyltransferase PlsY
MEMEVAVATIAGYLLGSIPFAFLLARRRGVDLRRAGSGNVGAANVLRTSGARDAVVAMCLDAVKGAAAVLVAQRLAAAPAVHVAAGLAAMIGHVYPIWLGLRGGKGVATAAGAFAVLSPDATLVAAGIFVAVVLVTRYISLGSIAGALTLVAATAVGDPATPVTIGAAGAAAVILYRHRANLGRVMTGTERRIGQRS